MSDQKKIPQKFALADRLRSFRYALDGLRFTFFTQHNAQIHVASTLAVLAIGWWLQLNANDWRWLVVAIVLVWLAELFNTAIEYLCDLISPEFHLAVRRAKDIAAGAVLVSSVGALVIGAVTFWPYLV